MSKKFFYLFSFLFLVVGMFGITNQTYALLEYNINQVKPDFGGFEAGDGNDGVTINWFDNPGYSEIFMYAEVSFEPTNGTFYNVNGECASGSGPMQIFVDSAGFTNYNLPSSFLVEVVPTFNGSSQVKQTLKISVTDPTATLGLYTLKTHIELTSPGNCTYYQVFNGTSSTPVYLGYTSLENIDGSAWDYEKEIPPQALIDPNLFPGFKVMFGGFGTDRINVSEEIYTFPNLSNSIILDSINHDSYYLRAHAKPDLVNNPLNFSNSLHKITDSLWQTFYYNGFSVAPPPNDNVRDLGLFSVKCDMCITVTPTPTTITEGLTQTFTVTKYNSDIVNLSSNRIKMYEGDCTVSTCSNPILLSGSTAKFSVMNVTNGTSGSHSGTATIQANTGKGLVNNEVYTIEIGSNDSNFNNDLYYPRAKAKITVIIPPPPSQTISISGPDNITAIVGGQTVNTTYTATVSNINTVDWLPSPSKSSSLLVVDIDRLPTSDSSSPFETVVTVNAPSNVPPGTTGTITLYAQDTDASPTESKIINVTIIAPPTITSPTATNITTTTATLGATVTSIGGTPVTVKGFCYKDAFFDPGFGSSTCATASGTSPGLFSANITYNPPYPAGTLMHYRGYATNSAGTSWTSEGTFGMPDLTASAVTPTAVTPGIPATFSATITNIGTANSNTNFQNTWQKASNVDGGGTIISLSPTSVVGGPLVPGEIPSAIVESPSLNFTVGETPSIRVCADQNLSFVGTNTESDEGNNCGPWTNISLEKSDLKAGAVSPTTVTMGVGIVFSSTISNVKPASTGAPFFNLFQYTDTDPYAKGNIFSSSALASGGEVHDITPALATGTLNGNSSRLVLKSTLPTLFSSAGTYWIRACADKDSAGDPGYITESNETNNCGIWTEITVTGAPDLVASAVTPTTAVVGIPTTYSSTITNQGTATTGTGFDNFIQITNDISQTKANPLSLPVAYAGTGWPVDLPAVYMNALDASASASTSQSYTFTSAGTYYIRACADKSNSNSSGTINTESNENNNCSAPWTIVTVSLSAMPDLVASNTIPNSAVVGIPITYFSTITNQGTATTGVSFTNLFQTSTLPNGGGIITDYPTTTTMSVLLPGESDNASVSITIPDTNPRYIRACADKSSAGDSGDITESDEGNNCSSSWTTVTVSATSTAPIISSPFSKDVANTSATLGATISSDGGSSISARGTCWSSTDSSPRKTDTSEVSCLDMSTPPGVGIFSHLRTGMPAGKLIYFSAYATNGIGTAYTTDATFTTLAPDLTADVVVPNEAVVNVPTTYYSTITNQGNYSTGISFTNMFQIADDTSGTNSTFYSVSGMATLSAGESATLSKSITLTDTNTHYIRACADNDSTFKGTIDEGSNEGNNCSSSWTTVTVSANNLPPTVVKPTVDDITSTSATLGATISSTGGSSISARGTCWSSTDSSPRIGDGGVSCLDVIGGIPSVGPFSHSRTGMPAGKLIYFSGYATNAIGTGYSPDSSFSTLGPTGTLSVTGCTILNGQSTCNASVTWTTQNVGSVAVTRDNPPNTIVSTATSGTNVSNTVNYGITSYYLYGDLNELANKKINVSCLLGSSWDGSKCEVIVLATTANLTLDPTSIVVGGSSTLSWSSSNANSCTGTNFNTGGATSGSTTVSPTVTTTYSVTCIGDEQQATDSATLTVTTAGKQPIYNEN